MSNDGVQATYDQVAGERRKTKEELAVDVLTSYKTYISLAIGAYSILAYTGYARIPNLKPLHWFLIGTFSAGYLLGGSRVKSTVEPYLSDTRVPVALTPVDGRVFDIVRIPRKTFSEFDVLGKRFPERESLYGTKVLAARAIDWANKQIAPAGDFPSDDKYPDDIDLIGEDSDAGAVMRYRNALLDDAERGRTAVKDETVQREIARQEAVNDFAEMFEELRNSDALELKDDPEVAAEEAEKVIRDMAIQNNSEGGDNE